eukprot:CAMPEP_0194534972 /NCGR_PEP_ID=MMETSP0253-20130528/73345_1 /TAXON_ID=2966 /ORGANISM="Noctiluca scintillans" /LENGTH=240 /DNA_ID=CAMNT_0039380683 /DNA_START=21 /DNA_END=743 /DNA_ORIENTATION=-
MSVQANDLSNGLSSRLSDNEVKGNSVEDGSELQIAEVNEGGGEPQEGTPSRASRTRFATTLLCTLAGVVAAEVWLLTLPSVPWIMDKVVFLICLVFQFLMGISFPLGRCLPRRSQGVLMDISHWAFVVMLFGSALVFWSWKSLVFSALLTLVSLAFRMSMQGSCLITVLAERSSMPPISRQQTTRIFGGLLCFILLRLLLMRFYGDGFPYNKIFPRTTRLSRVPPDPVDSLLDFIEFDMS